MTAEELDGLWDFDDAIGSEARFREATRALSPADEPIRAEILTQLARALGLQGRFDEANQFLDEASALASVSCRAQIRHDLERGRVLRSSGQPELARPCFVTAWELARDAGEAGLAIDALHMVALVEPEAAEQLEWNERAIAFARESSDPLARRWLASLYNNVGWTYHDSGRFDDALALFSEARDLREERGDRRGERIARYCVARCLRSMGKFQRALDMQLKLATEGTNDGYVDEEIGECLLALGRTEEAAPHFAIAWERLSKDPWMVQNEADRLARLAEFAERR